MLTPAPRPVEQNPGTQNSDREIIGDHPRHDVDKCR